MAENGPYRDFPIKKQMQGGLPNSVSTSLVIGGGHEKPQTRLFYWFRVRPLHIFLMFLTGPISGMTPDPVTVILQVKIPIGKFGPKRPL